MADGQGQIYLNGTLGNRIDFNNTGIAVPSLNARSLGTKLVLFPSVSTSTADFAIGVELGAIWNSIGATTSAFKWYTNATNIATLSGNGNFNLTGTLTAPAIMLNGTSLQTTLDSKATKASPTFTGTLTLNDASSNLVLSVDSASRMSSLNSRLQAQDDTSTTVTI